MRYFRPYVVSPSNRWRRRLWISVTLLAVLLPISRGLAVRDPTGFSSSLPQPLSLVQTQATATPTATSVASGTPTVTLTPLFTPTPSPTPTTEPQPLGDVRIALDATPAEVHPGEVVTYTIHLTNAGQAPLTHLTISDTLPAGLVYVPDSAGSGQYDPPTRHLTWTLAGLDPGVATTLSFQARVVPAAPNPILNTVEVSSPELPSRPTATASVHVRHAAEWLVLPDEAAHVAAPGGRVTLEVPAGAVDQPARFAYRSLDARPLTGGRTGLALQFEFTAFSVAAGAPITHFQKPLRLIVDLTDLVDVDILQPDETLFVGYRDPATGQWQPLPLIARRPGPILTVELDHFTLLGAGTDHEYESGWVLAFNDAHVSRFDGGFTYSYPLQVPPGRGGLQPDLNLSYNSRRVDGTLRWIQTDWAGLGWNVDTVEIVRKLTIHNYPEDAQHWKWGTTGYENAFTLLFNGAGYELKPAAAGQYYGRYHTADERFLSIERRNAPWCADQGGCTPEEQADNVTSEYWIVRTKEGTEYRLGYTADAAQVASGLHFSYDWGSSNTPPQDATYAGETEHVVVFRWRLDRVTDPQGNRITLRYDEETDDPDTPGSVGYRDRASYLREVCYNQIEVNGEERCGNRVHFERLPRGAGTDPVSDYEADGPSKFYFYQQDYLDRIQVQFWNSATITYETQSEYVLSYVPGTARPDPLETRLLDRITPKGRAGQTRPATTFDYDVYRNKGWNCTTGCTLWDQESFRYERLTGVHNGYGGVITTTYQTPDQHDDQYQRAWNYRVDERRTKDRGAVVRQVDYTYPPNEDLDQRCYDNDDDQVCDDPASFAGGPTGGKLIGYQTVTETLKTATGDPVSITEHDFWLRDIISPTFALGREVETRVMDPAGPPLRTVQRTYSDDTAGRPAGVHFIRLDQVDTYAGNTNAPHTRTEYSYDAYGNSARVVEHGNVNLAGDERTTHYRYYPKDDGTRYVVDRVARASVYAGEHLTDDDDPTTLKARTRYHYDLVDSGDPLVEPQPQAWTNEPSAGLLTQVDAWNGGLTGNDGDYAITGYRYDDWGNPIRVTDPLSRTTTTEYDDLFHTYPVTVTNALGQVTTAEYYGVNGSSATGAGAYFGQIEAVTDPNGATTRYTYDEFGRLTQVFRPDDTGTNDTPSLVYAYHDADLEPQTPFMRATWRKQAAGAQPWSTGGTFERRFYDGLGRLIQVQTPYQDWQGGGVGQRVVRFTQHDAQGQVAAASVPYLAPAYVYDPNCNGTGRTCNPYQAPDLSKPQTTYAYDALGRPTDVTQPDGTTTSRQYYVAWNDADPDFAGGDLYDPETGEPCGDTGCVTPSKPEAEVAAGVALDVAVAEMGGRVVGKVVQKGTGALRTVMRGGDEAGAALQTTANTHADFYVRPNGEVIPARGYRYSKGKQFVNAVKTGKLPAKKEGTYFSFGRYELASVAKDRLQLPYEPEFGVEFDTLSIIDNTHIPRGRWGQADYLEPLTRDFPQWGSGGGTQAVTYSPIPVNPERLWRLR